MDFTTVRDDSYGDERWIEVSRRTRTCCWCSACASRMSRGTPSPTFTLIENEDGTITNDWELRDDDGEWTPWRHTTMTPGW